MSKGKTSKLNDSFDNKDYSGSSSGDEDMSPCMTQSINLRSDEEDRDISKKWVEECPDLNNLAKAFRLDRIVDAIKNRDIEMEFRILIRITETNHHTRKIIDYCPQTIKLNRYSTVLPCRRD